MNKYFCPHKTKTHCIIIYIDSITEFRNVLCYLVCKSHITISHLSSNNRSFTTISRSYDYKDTKNLIKTTEFF